MPSQVKNRITLHGADQKEIDKVIDFLKSKDREVNFNNIIPMPEELMNAEAGSKVDTAWVYYQAKELGNYVDIDKMIAYEWVGRKGIKTRGELLDCL